MPFIIKLGIFNLTSPDNGKFKLVGAFKLIFEVSAEEVAGVGVCAAIEVVGVLGVVGVEVGVAELLTAEETIVGVAVGFLIRLVSLLLVVLLEV